MILAHVVDSWTQEADRQREPFFTLFFIGGLASPLFLFLAGLAGSMSAAAKARRAGSHAAGAAAARARGWEIFVLGLVFRLQAQLLGLGPLTNLLKVDMLNAMGLSMVAASWAWQASPDRRRRIAIFALVTAAISLLTPFVRATPWLAPLPDPIEAYLRPAGVYTAFPLFPWAGFLFAGALVGDLIDGVRQAPHRQPSLQAGLMVTAVAGVWLAWTASFQPALFPTARFWHDSPTFFFIRLGVCTLTIPVAWLVERLIWRTALQPIATLGRSSLFAYWIHIEMVYGVIAEPIKRSLPLWQALVGTVLITLLVYALVLLKNRWLERHELKGSLRWLAPVLR
jgi:acyltransferase